jgi:hypothetical protein
MARRTNNFDTGIYPQLLTEIRQGQARRFIEDDGWWMQEKFDGKRLLIQRDGPRVIGINRKGCEAPLPAAVAEAAAALGGSTVISASSIEPSSPSSGPTSITVEFDGDLGTVYRIAIADGYQLIGIDAEDGSTTEYATDEELVADLVAGRYGAA